MKSAAPQILATEVTEGAGVTVFRTIGTPALRNFDPFLMLDQINSDDPGEYIAGFPSHPHRGFITFTYMIDGDMEHKDSMGNSGNLGSGGAQWMKAASGVIHSEMPKQENGLLRGFQLWINLPSANKMDMPEYQEYKQDAFPQTEQNGVIVKVLIGQYQKWVSPIVDEITAVSYLDVIIPADNSFETVLNPQQNSFVYLFEGAAKINDESIDEKTLLTFESADQINVTTKNEHARFLLVSGKPINESIVQHGPFVMNTREEIDQAMHDYHNNQFIRDKAWINNRQKSH